MQQNPPAIILPSYVPVRFYAVKFKNTSTGSVCTVPAEQLSAYATEQIEHFKASASAATTTTKKSEAKGNRRRTLIQDLQQTVTEVMKNLPNGSTTPLLPKTPPTEPKGDVTPTLTSTGDNTANDANKLSISTTTTTATTSATKADQDDDHDYWDGGVVKEADNNDDDDEDKDDKKKKKKRKEPLGDEEEEEEEFRAAAPPAKQQKKQKPKQPDVVALRDNDRQQRSRGNQYTQQDVQKLLRNTLARVLPPLNTPVFDDDYLHTSIEVAWNRYEVRMIEQIYFRVPMIVACTSTLKGQVLSEGIKYMRENVELLPSNDFYSYTTRHLEAFARQALDALMMYGVIPICYEMDAVTRQRWPYVPACGTFLIKRHDVRGALRYRFYWTSLENYNNAWRREPMVVRDGAGFRYVGRMEGYACGDMNDRMSGIYDPTVEIIHSLGHDILSNGSLSSKLATLLGTAYARTRSQRSRVIAESNSAAPTLMTEYDHAGEAKQSQNFKQGFYTSASGQQPDGADIRNVTYQRDMATKEAFAGLMQHYESITGADAGDRFGVEHEEYRNDLGGTAVVKPESKTADGVVAPYATQYHVSAARRIVNGPQSHASTDYCQFMELLEDEVCNVFGVPRTYINGTSIKSTGELIMNRFSDEVTQLKKKISDVLTHCYRVLFLAEDVAEYMSSEFRIARQSALLRSASDSTTAPLLTEDDLYETETLKRVHVTFAKKPSESVEELQKLFAFGGIGQNELRAELARRNNFDPQQIPDSADDEEIPLEMRRMLVPEFAEYIKLQFAEREAEKQMKFQEKQAKNDQEFQRDQLESQERVAKEAAKQKAKAGASK